MRDFLHGFLGHLSCGHYPLIYRYLVHEFFIKTFIIMSTSTKVYITYVCDPLALNISLINNYIDPITLNYSILINYLYKK